VHYFAGYGYHNFHSKCYTREYNFVDGFLDQLYLFSDQIRNIVVRVDFDELSGEKFDHESEVQLLDSLP
jgi:hypothetical protein